MNDIGKDIKNSDNIKKVGDALETAAEKTKEFAQGMLMYNNIEHLKNVILTEQFC